MILSRQKYAQAMSTHAKVSDIFKKYYSELKGHLSHKFGNENDSDDIIQDAFHNILNVKDFEAIDNPKAYLFRAARNVALNRMRRHNLHQDYVESHDAQDSISQEVERSIIAKNDLTKVKQALEKLPPKDRETFLLNRIEGKSYREISEELNVTVSTVEKRMMKVLAKIRKSLDQ